HLNGTARLRRQHPCKPHPTPGSPLRQDLTQSSPYPPSSFDTSPDPGCTLYNVPRTRVPLTPGPVYCQDSNLKPIRPQRIALPLSYFLASLDVPNDYQLIRMRLTNNEQKGKACLAPTCHANEY